jgi:hypothetical protein
MPESAKSTAVAAHNQRFESIQFSFILDYKHTGPLPLAQVTEGQGLRLCES